MKIILKQYDYDKNENVEVGEVDTYTIAKNLTDESMHKLLEDYLNSFSQGERSGQRLGKLFHSTHRTLQGTLIEWVFGILKGIAEQQWTDARNELGVSAARLVTILRAKGDIPTQPFI